MTDTPDHGTRAHARFSPSGAHRWANCPGSIRAERGLPDTAGTFARHGTAAHELAEWCGKNELPPANFAGDPIAVQGETFEVDHEMTEAVELYLETVNADAAPGDTLTWEKRYNLPFLPGESFGTADATRYDPETQTLRVYDLKYGQGVAVEAVENLQGLCYAGGAVYALGAHCPVRRVEVVIVQPRAFHPEGPVRRWMIDVVDLSERLADLRQAAERTMDPQAPRKPGSWCRFCKAQATCATLSSYALAEAQMVFNDTPVDPDTLTPEQVGNLLLKAAVIRSWIGAVETHVYSLLNAGTQVPGWKLVDKRPRRSWADESAARDALLAMGLPAEKVEETSLRSPAQVEKLMPRAQRGNLAPFVVKQSSGTTVAPAGDKRPAANPEGATGRDYRAAFTPIET